MRGGLRQRCEARLRDITVPDPFDVSAFCAQLAERRGRALHVLPLPRGLGPEGPCGLWIATDNEDLIFVESGTSPLHREHIVVHEVAHIICGHADGGGAESVARLLVDLDPTMVKAVLARAGYTSEQEQEAELLASLILARARRRAGDGAAAQGGGAEVAAVLDRAAEVFGTRRG